MASVDELRKHVFDDAWEIAALTGMAIPLIEATLTDEEADTALRFLRRHFARSLVLAVTRLLDDKNPYGPTGTKASLPLLIKSARKAHRLSNETFDHYAHLLQTLKLDYSARGGNYGELLAFRHSELAHSLQRHSQSDDLILFHPLWDLAHDTFELVADVVNSLDQTGMDTMALENRFDVWRNIGAAFWAPLLATAK